MTYHPQPCGRQFFAQCMLRTLIYRIDAFIDSDIDGQIAVKSTDF